jgi:hypothetical protein
MENIENFQKDENILVALLSLKTGATGLTLTAASNVVFAEVNTKKLIITKNIKKIFYIYNKLFIYVKYFYLEILNKHSIIC